MNLTQELMHNQQLGKLLTLMGNKTPHYMLTSCKRNFSALLSTVLKITMITLVWLTLRASNMKCLWVMPIHKR